MLRGCSAYFSTTLRSVLPREPRRRYGEGPEPFPQNLSDLADVFAELARARLRGRAVVVDGRANIDAEVGVAGSAAACARRTSAGSATGAPRAAPRRAARPCAPLAAPPPRASRRLADAHPRARRSSLVRWSALLARARAVSQVHAAFDGKRAVRRGPRGELGRAPSCGVGGHAAHAVMWTGDDAGSYDYVRWQVPTLLGCGLSAQAHASGDVDGIFGGAPETYVRDMQFKALTTTAMVMSGWAANPDKQPWAWGEPYTTINRACLGCEKRARRSPLSLCLIVYELASARFLDRRRRAVIDPQLKAAALVPVRVLALARGVRRGRAAGARAAARVPRTTSAPTSPTSPARRTRSSSARRCSSRPSSTPTPRARASTSPAEADDAGADADDAETAAAVWSGGGTARCTPAGARCRRDATPLEAARRG